MKTKNLDALLTNTRCKVLRLKDLVAGSEKPIRHTGKTFFKKAKVSAQVADKNDRCPGMGLNRRLGKKVEKGARVGAGSAGVARTAAPM